MSNIAFSASIPNLSFSLIYDEDCQSPRNELDCNIAHFLVDPRCRSGSIDNLDSSIELLNSLAKKLRIRNYADMEQFELLKAIQKKDSKHEHIVVEPLYKYEHSGVVYATSPFSCRWDSGQVGHIFSTANDFERIGAPWNLDQAKKYITSEIDTYNQYLMGSCFGFKVEEISTCDSCTTKHFDELEACWGYIGEEKEIIKMIANDYLDPYPSLKQKVLESI
jgi:hypothetical protein